ncbi:uncharacterized protein LOC135113333 [Scylla paramamosain]|uniref:uncharacterized protein LOC135113333 n=1 Tax=Scylla paramamosain TaxID=85552 RepID=UPI0030839141
MVFSPLICAASEVTARRGRAVCERSNRRNKSSREQYKSVKSWLCLSPRRTPSCLQWFPRRDDSGSVSFHGASFPPRRIKLARLVWGLALCLHHTRSLSCWW